ncbi:MAG: Abi family protein [Oscillospiraceae bacterium]|nr:Abi family protein [Oscillospiraceae bacterium]
MSIANEEDAKVVLSKINYYRLTGYSLQFRKSENDSDFISNTSFDKIHKIYKFDERLRNTLRRYIEITEVFYRTQISYGFSMSKCVDSPHDQHYDEKNYYKKKEFNEVKNHLEKDNGYYKDSLIVKHHKVKYNDRMPLWVMVELLSFSDISKLFSCMYFSEQNNIAKAIGVSAATLENHLHCLSVLRNKCAHAARLYNTKFHPAVRFNPQFLRSNQDVKNDTLFAYILILIKRLPDKSIKREMVNDIYTIIEEYKSDIDLSLIGFPKNYNELLKKQIM